jgi:predicted transcriptional regulator
MSDKRTMTMTLNLNDAEMAALEQLAARKELSKTAVIRQALRLYQLLDDRIAKGQKLYFEDENAKKKSELMLL